MHVAVYSITYTYFNVALHPVSNNHLKMRNFPAKKIKNVAGAIKKKFQNFDDDLKD